MVSHYDTLGIEKTADARQIKRAYFELVKQFPPERFPDKFKEIRAAYDALSDEETRTKYDEAAALPQEVVFLYNQAQKAKKQGQHEHVADIYKMILDGFPELPSIWAEYARSLEAIGKTGKAIEAWDTLCKLKPDNAAYTVALADCYEMRGWRRKAIDAYKRAISIDDGNAECWASLIECHLSANEFEEVILHSAIAVEILKKKGIENVYIYSCAAVFSTMDCLITEGYLKDIVRLAQTGKASAKEIESAIPFLIVYLGTRDCTSFYPYLQELADTVPSLQEGVRSILLEEERSYQVGMLEENGFSALFYDFFTTLIKHCDCENCRLDMAAMECNILENITTLRPQILRLKKEYPQLYSLHDAFLNEALITRDPDRMMSPRLKFLAKHDQMPSYLTDKYDDELPVQQTVRRDGPKIGRNDPCPCGSGKKYKKCCGG